MSILNKVFQKSETEFVFVVFVYKTKATSTKEVYTVAVHTESDKPRRSSDCAKGVLFTVEGGRDWWNTVAKVETKIKEAIAQLDFRV